MADDDKPLDEPFLKRWSRRKTEPGGDQDVPDPAAGEAPVPVLPDAAAPGAPAEEGAAPDPDATAPGGPVEEGAPPDPDAAEAPAIDPADLPDVESLDAESDYSVFMQEGVPDDLRKRALSKLFMSNPLFSKLDGLNDYDDDYSMIGTVVEHVETIYKVGRGFLEDSDIIHVDDADDADDAESDEDGGAGENISVRLSDPDAPDDPPGGQGDGPDADDAGDADDASPTGATASADDDDREPDRAEPAGAKKTRKTKAQS